MITEQQVFELVKTGQWTAVDFAKWVSTVTSKEWSDGYEEGHTEGYNDGHNHSCG